MAVHGGISPELTTLDNFKNINRFQEPPTKGMFCDLLWADPLNDESAGDLDYVYNSDREWSYMFGKKPLK